MYNDTDFLEVPKTLCTLTNEIENQEDARINHLRKISYGFIMPTICFFGIIGNILNLIVLTRRNMQGTAYIYMRGYSVSSLLAISFCIPFTLRVLINKESGGWSNWLQAFYHVHLELYFGNGCLGVGVMMLLALTVERHASVCLQPSRYAGRGRGRGRPACGSPRLTLFLLPLATFFLYLPSVFRAEITTCSFPGQRQLLLYRQRDNVFLLQSAFYQVYKVMLELVFKIGPTLLLAVLNLRIMLVYRRSCKRRRQLRRGRGERETRGFAEERRLMLLLGSTSLLFLLCVSPMVILNLTLSEDNLTLYPYQIFRALANLLEVTNYSMTFYIYCLFSEDFRNTLLRTFNWPRAPAASKSSPTPTPTPTPNPVAAV